MGLTKIFKVCLNSLKEAKMSAMKDHPENGMTTMEFLGYLEALQTTKNEYTKKCSIVFDKINKDSTLTDSEKRRYAFLVSSSMRQEETYDLIEICREAKKGNVREIESLYYSEGKDKYYDSPNQSPLRLSTQINMPNYLLISDTKKRINQKRSELNLKPL